MSTDDDPFDIAHAHAQGLLDKVEDAIDSIGRFTSVDPLFTECLLEFVKYYWLSHKQPQYREWKKGDGADFGVVAEPISATAKVAIIGDWGTGMPDAEVLLRRLLLNARPEVVIHLGDVYYSGTHNEFKHNFSDVIARVLDQTTPAVAAPRVYAIPGNHDYYAGGAPFYSLIKSLGHGQEASFFSLRSADGRYQFLGMDTGFGDRVPAHFFDNFYRAPVPHSSEVEWLRDRIERFKGSTILLSHHQPFSASARLNGPQSLAKKPNVNEPLIEAFTGLLDRVPAWFWGHEHCLIAFGDGQHGIQKGRLVGCSAFEVEPDEDPYIPKYEDVKLQPLMLNKWGGWYNHGCAVVDLGQPSIAYYELPAWRDLEPTPAPELSLLYEEKL